MHSDRQGQLQKQRVTDTDRQKGRQVGRLTKRETERNTERHV